MCKILSIDTEAESDYKVPVNPSDLTVLEALAFGYDVTWPISLILNRKALACYQMLFRHLLYCKHVEKMLSNVWLATKVVYSSYFKLGYIIYLRREMLFRFLVTFKFCVNKRTAPSKCLHIRVNMC